ncbi:PREDICTED: uncharacterized protein LOC105970054 isoform X1 [Erythranthe guttata]|uniref:uncharacterized protein LOC105970054 isoform X1 n=1 Tax=Erythranthe guttata TaxID=4155 RepID=UPI00064D96FD|nr:PREDICTED: uncharacterized protein LOC105970054 isoform X1 [Erythranthe guttata]|eukprot:XP_012850285.1 PREDICTED: uncharacterized protein LOC105970054 isoform X1 [Erythranthe guttata]
MEAGQVETGDDIQMEADQVETDGIQTESGEAKTCGIQIEAGLVETGSIKIGSNQVESGGIQTEASKVETCGIHIEATQIKTGGIQIEAIQVETGRIQTEASQVEAVRIQTEASQVEAGGIQIEASQVETGGIQIEASQVETGIIQIEASNVETGGIQTEAIKVETVRIQTEASQVETGGIQIESSQVETGGIQIESSQVETGRIQTEASQVETGGIQIEVSQVETGGIQIEVSQVETGGIQTKASQVETGGIQTEASQVETGRIQTEASQVVTGGIRTEASQVETGGIQTEACRVETEASQVETGGIQTEACQVETEASQVETGGIQIEASQVETGGIQTEVGVAEIGGSDDKTIETSHVLANPPARAEHVDSPKFVRTVVSSAKKNTPSVPKFCDYESRLRRYCNKVGIKPPVYETIIGGPSHKPFYRSSVTVDNVRYDSLPRFSSREAAEKSAAEVALSKLYSSVGMEFVISQPMNALIKGLLYEYTTSMNYAPPLYECIRNEEKGKTPMFSCIVEIRGIKYAGASAGTKKHAVTNAARTAMLAIHSATPSSENQTDNSADCVIPPKKVVPDLGISTEGPTAAAEPNKILVETQPRKRKKKRDVKIGTSGEGTTCSEVNTLAIRSATPLSESQTDKGVDTAITQKDLVISGADPTAAVIKPNKCHLEIRERKRKAQVLEIGTSGGEGSTCLEVNTDSQAISAIESPFPSSEIQMDKNEVPDLGITAAAKRSKRARKMQKQAVKVGNSVEGTTPLEVNMDIQDILPNQSAAPLSENQTDNIADNVITQKNEVPDPRISTEGPAAKRVDKCRRRKTKSQKQALKIGTSVEGTTPLEVNMDIQDILPNQSAPPVSENQADNIVDNVTTQKNEVPDPGISTEGPAAKRVDKRRRRKTKSQKQALKIGTSVEGTTPLEVDTTPLEVNMDTQDILATQSAAPLSENQTDNIVDNVITQKNEIPAPGISTEGPAAKRVKKRHRQKTETQKQALEIGTSVEGTTPLEVNTDIQDILANQSAAPLSENQTNNIVDDVITQKNEVPGPGISTEGPAAKRVKKRHRQKTETQKQALESGTSVEGTTSSAGPAVSAAIKPIKTSFKNQQWKENRQAFNRYASGVGTNSQALADSRIAGAVVPPHNGSSDFIPRTSQHHHIDQSPMTQAGMQREKISSDMDDRKPQYVTYPWVPPPINTIYYQNYSGLDMDLG